MIDIPMTENHNNTTDMTENNRTWLACAKEDKCRHADAIRKLGFINWAMRDNYKFSIGDTIYLFMSDTQSVRYKMVVEDEYCDREDQKFWKIAPDDKTYKLKFVKEYKGNMLSRKMLSKYGLTDHSLQTPMYRNKRLLSYISSVFDANPMLIVDMYSGRYVKYKQGHESQNLKKNEEDSRYYGYCPPHDDIDITNLGAKKSDESISGITVIYTEKLSNSSDRQIIAFCENATVHRHGIIDKRLKRTIKEDGRTVHFSYTIESDTLVNLTGIPNKFIIHIRDYSTHMFRMQHFFSSTYPELDKKIREYIASVLDAKEVEDDYLFQEKINDTDIDDSRIPEDTLNTEPQYSIGGDTQSVRKNPRIAKLSLKNSHFKCAMDNNHLTFKTRKGIPYMEGHHLIPCTYSNAAYYWDKFGRNIDCIDNIVCLCPTCHRMIHYASESEKKIIIKKLFEKQKEKLYHAGIKISLEELFELYNIIC